MAVLYDNYESGIKKKKKKNLCGLNVWLARVRLRLLLAPDYDPADVVSVSFRLSAALGRASGHSLLLLTPMLVFN